MEVELGAPEIAEITTSTARSIIFHLTDHLQSSSVDTDENGEIVQILDYFPYGDERINQHAVDYENDYRFTGKERDKTTGLLYYESRYYDSGIGRFMSIDPWAGDISNPQTLNKYAYTVNNPLKYVDPTGEFFVDALFNEAGESFDAQGNVIQPESTNGLQAVTGIVTGKVKLAKNALSVGGDIVKKVKNKVDRSFELPTGGKIKGYTKHGRERALIRNGVGVDPKATINAVKNPTKIEKQIGGTTKYIGKGASTVLNKGGYVVSTFGKARHKIQKAIKNATTKSKRKKTKNGTK